MFSDYVILYYKAKSLCICLFVCLFSLSDNKLTNRNRNRNRKLKTSKALLKSQAHQGTSLFTSAATNQRGVSKGGQEKLRSEFQSTRRGQSSLTLNVGT